MTVDDLVHSASGSSAHGGRQRPALLASLTERQSGARPSMPFTWSSRACAAGCRPWGKGSEVAGGHRAGADVRADPAGSMDEVGPAPPTGGGSSLSSL